ncbi:chloramphenicol-sensitive protein RarD [Brevundimonas nasdae]|uniref:EamA family transporter RarD n=1 Tax=Brevundimonas nasdae TaxID=172043 RepID=UPI001911BFE9|nr:EamA family transporter RarD [Brevundimonas nasdae]MBK6025322.1 EamA family transporter RarD [Brevundimonas nasdae]MDQ0451896.1 chloramphenicol-sensitive protein RarD [Brevundimonas nasdae]
MSATATATPTDGRAVGTAIACYTLWGLLPLLFMAMAAHGFTAPEILAHRAVWSVFIAAIVLLLAGQSAEARQALSNPRIFGWLIVSALLIGTNWSLYVVATTHHATLEASLGYYINPLLNMAAGAVLFREKIDRLSGLAIGLAAVGVVIQTIALGHVPIIGLTLALTFCAYAVIRKRVQASAQTGLFVECLVLLPIGATFLGWLVTHGQAVGFSSPTGLAWALFSGPATVVPLALFAWSARRLPLSTVGFIQFLAPTLQFACGVWAGEKLTLLRIISFAFIWAGAGVFAAAAFRRSRAAREAIRAVETV